MLPKALSAVRDARGHSESNMSNAMDCEPRVLFLLLLGFLLLLRCCSCFFCWSSAASGAFAFGGLPGFLFAAGTTLRGTGNEVRAEKVCCAGQACRSQIGLKTSAYCRSGPSSEAQNLRIRQPARLWLQPPETVAFESLNFV